MVVQRFEDMRAGIVSLVRITYKEFVLMQIVLAYSGGLDTSVLLKQFVEPGTRSSR